MKLIVCLLLAGCAQRVKVEPLTVQPIHVTIDVNVHEPPKPASR